MLAAACGAVLAQDPPGNPTPSPTGETSTISGTVVSSSSTALVIKTDSGTRMTFALDSNSMKPDTMTNGDRVTVDYHSLAGGKYHAAMVSKESTAVTPTPPNYAERGTETTNRYETSRTEDLNRERAEERNEHARNMPRTASQLPLLALMGAVTVGAALGLRVFSRMAS
jgi:hypothetical protein